MDRFLLGFGRAIFVILVFGVALWLASYWPWWASLLAIIAAMAVGYRVTLGSFERPAHKDDLSGTSGGPGQYR